MHVATTFLTSLAQLTICRPCTDSIQEQAIKMEHFKGGAMQKRHLFGARCTGISLRLPSRRVDDLTSTDLGIKGFPPWKLPLCMTITAATSIMFLSNISYALNISLSPIRTRRWYAKAKALCGLKLESQHFGVQQTFMKLLSMVPNRFASAGNCLTMSPPEKTASIYIQRL